MSARPKHREAIVAAAVRLFRRQGFAATGLAQIVEASGAPKGSLYHYFPAGKAAIGAAAIQAAGKKVATTIAALPRGERPGDFQREYARLMAGWMRASGYRDGCPIAATVLEEAADDDAIAGAARAAFAAWRAVLADHLRAAGRDAGSADRLALLSVTAMEGALVLARAERADAPILETGEALAALMD
ncbi:MAG TPA: helix-turn-helix domain-containing protein [Caulobacter sp.]|nr:helix-turn-helix domain-containing protein [Caulobacter sp.]